MLLAWDKIDGVNGVVGEYANSIETVSDDESPRTLTLLLLGKVIASLSRYAKIMFAMASGCSEPTEARIEHAPDTGT